MKRVELAETAGFCFGVRRAVELAEETLEQYGKCAMLGAITHNRHVVQKLEIGGAYTIDNPEQVQAGDPVIIRSHGAPRETLIALQFQGAFIIDATCPNVKKIHDIVESATKQGRQVIIIGEREHPEVTAAAGWAVGDNAENSVVILESAPDLETWLNTDNYREKSLSVVFQTTGEEKNMEICGEILKKWCTNAEIFDTICKAVSKRQAAARILAQNCDALIVIGGRNSANSQRLAALCREHCQHVVFAESAAEINPAQFKTANTVGITAGASTPSWIIKEVYQTMQDEIMKTTENEVTITPPDAETAPAAVPPAPIAEVAPVAAPAAAEPDEESFAALVETSIKTIRTGEKVTGIVTAISPTEVSVELGAKQSAYIPVDEITDDPTAKLEDLVQIGQEIRAYVMRVNDVEGMIMLSKKRLDMAQSWDELEVAYKEKTILEATVTEENKGGVVVRMGGARVFIPGPHTDIPRGQPFTGLLGQKVKFRIIELNQSRRRVVGSIRSVTGEAKRAAEKAIWESIEIGKRYTGRVKNLMSYGVFIDIGGVDGMLHVSELSWNHINHPKDLVKAGDEIEVYIRAFDKEARRISLGHKDPNADPWKLFSSKYELGSVAKVKIVRLADFGAFAEIVPGIDGLIHVSQIADRRIGKPSEFLTIGQEIDVKITAVDAEKKNVSLSIRALIEESKPEPVAYVSEEAAPEPQDSIVYDTDINKPEPIVEEKPEAVASVAEEPEPAAEMPKVDEPVVEAVAEPASETAEEPPVLTEDTAPAE